MLALPTVLILGVTLFVATNIDDLFVLLGFFADPAFAARQVVIGQSLGIGALVAASVAASLVALAIPHAWIGLLGLVPVAIGCRKSFDLWRGRERSEEELQRHPSRGTHGQAFAVAAVTIANGGDNIAVYTPLFAVHSGIDTAVIASVFAAMTIAWCAIAHWMVHHRTIGAPIRRNGHRLLPFVLIGLGAWILHEAGTLALVHGAWQGL
jgi:cadmium resistance protein CadD (predicted permease)